MNKKGQMLVLNIMMAFIAITSAIIFIEPLKDVIDVGRTELSCIASFSTLNTGDAMTCIFLDIILPIFVLCVMGVGIAYLYNKNVP